MFNLVSLEYQYELKRLWFILLLVQLSIRNRRWCAFGLWDTTLLSIHTGEMQIINHMQFWTEIMKHVTRNVLLNAVLFGKEVHYNRLKEDKQKRRQLRNSRWLLCRTVLDLTTFLAVDSWVSESQQVKATGAFGSDKQPKGKEQSGRLKHHFSHWYKHSKSASTRLNNLS